ncbi:MAG: cytochrome c peroxidase [Acidobacteriota bacterium]|nr:cytochrome c peroxidase [Acidobacteriota bacterium]
MSSRHYARRLIACAMLVLIAACGRGPTGAQLDADNPIRPNAPPPFGMEEFFAGAPEPSPARVRLGRWLFYDQRLSADQTVSCATCHRPEHAFSEPVAVATGMGGQQGRRKTPSLVNLRARTFLMAEGDPGPAFFWDGRATSLEQQVLMPIADPREMGFDHPAMIQRLSNIPGYRRYFVEAFGANTITADQVAAALADFVRTRMSGNAPYDRWAYGRDGSAMSPQAQLGSDIFSFKGRCGVCHAGFNYSDGMFHNLGIGWNAETQSFADEGRMAVSHSPTDRGRFKTPGLRDVAKHAPYMHDGSLATLRDVVEFYNRGGNRNPWQSRRIVPLGLTAEEVDELVAFLEALNGEGYEDRPPRYFPR